MNLNDAARVPATEDGLSKGLRFAEKTSCFPLSRTSRRLDRTHLKNRLLPAESSALSPCYPPVLHGGMPLASLGPYGLALARRRAGLPSRAFRTSLTKACPPDGDGPAGIREKESKRLPCHPGGASGGGLGMRTLGQAMARHCAAWKEAWWHDVVLPNRSAGKSFSVFGHIRFSHGVAQGTSRGPHAVGGSPSVPEGAMESIVWVTNKGAAAVQLKRARAAARAKPSATHRFRRRVPRARCGATMPHIGSARRPQRGRHRRGR